MPAITIIITAYQDRGWIEKAIQSAEYQTFKDYDIIFCSDGNFELKWYADKYCIPFYCFPKSNYSSMVNKTVLEAKGEWIKILHDDDLLTPFCLTNLYETKGNADLVYGNALIFRDEELSSAVVYKPPEVVTLKTLLPITSCPVNFEAELFRRQMFLDIGGFDINLGYSEDYDFLIRVIAEGYKINYCDSNVVWYRHHDRQLTGHEPEMRTEEQIYLTQKHMNLLVKNIKW